MKPAKPILAAFALAIVAARALQCTAADKYERLDPSVSCALEGVSFERQVTKDGYKYLPGGEVRALLCAGQEIELTTRRLEGSGDHLFVATKKYGSIRVVFGEGLLSPTFEFWVTPEQNAALKALKRK